MNNPQIVSNICASFVLVYTNAVGVTESNFESKPWIKDPSVYNADTAKTLQRCLDIGVSTDAVVYIYTAIKQNFLLGAVARACEKYAEVTGWSISGFDVQTMVLMLVWWCGGEGNDTCCGMSRRSGDNEMNRDVIRSFTKGREVLTSYRAVMWIVITVCIHFTFRYVCAHATF